MSEREEFLQALDPEATYFTFQTFPELPSSPNWPRLLCGSLSVVEHTLLRLNAEGSGIFVAVNAFPHGASRRIENFERARAVWLDWDHKLESLPDTWPLDPHIIVNTSPGKFHVYWRCEDMPISDHWAIEKALVKLGHDPNACDIARVLRMPGFMNFKDPANPYQASLLFNRKGRPYSREELFRAFDVANPEPTPAPDPKPIAADTGSYDLILTQICTQSALKTRSDASVGRHAQLYWVGRRMRESGLPNDSKLFQKAFDMCQEWYRPTDTQGEIKPFKPSEVKTIADGYGKGGDGVGVKMTDPGGGSAQCRPNTTYGGAADAMRDHREEGSVASISVHDYNHNHEYLKDLDIVVRELMPGKIKLLVDAHEAAAFKPQPRLAILAALSTLSVPLLRRFRTPVDSPAALYCLGIAPTGQGKEAGLRMITQTVGRGKHGYRLSGRFKSESSVEWALVDCPAQLAVMDEFGMLLRFSKTDSGAHSGAALDKLVELYNKAHDYVQMGRYSKRGKDANERKAMRKDESVYAPTIGLHSVTTPETLFASLSAANVASGFLNRFLVVLSDDCPKLVLRPARFNPPPSVVDWMEVIKGRWERDTRARDVIDAHDEAVDCLWLDMGAGAIQELERLAEQVDERRKALTAGSAHAAELLTRTIEKTYRVATIVTLSEDPYATALDEDAVRWASAYVLSCDLRLIHAVGDHMAENDQEATVKRVLAIIGKIPGISSRDLTRQTQWLKSAERRDILQTLIESGQIRFEDVRTLSNRPQIRYWRIRK